MDFNDLTGELPAELFDLNQLQQLDLNDNQLEGPLPTEIGQLTTLTFVQLDHNLLSGTIPTEMGELNALRKYTISTDVWSELMMDPNHKELCLKHRNCFLQ
jgi:Leucine-rich repeat (LRR) protein